MIKFKSYLFLVSSLFVFGSCASTSNGIAANYKSHSNNTIKDINSDNDIVLTFDENGGILDGSKTLNFVKGKKFSELKNVPTAYKEGVGTQPSWIISSTSEVVTKDTTFTQSETLKANWKLYNVTFDPNGGTLEGTTSFSNRTIIHSDEVKTPYKVNMTFDGWYINDKIQTFPFIPSGDNIDITLKAHYSDKEKVKIAFYANTNGAFSDSKKTKYIEVAKDIKWSEITKPSNPDYNGNKMFDQWYYNGNPIEDTFTFSSSALLKAHYIDSKQITFNANGGTWGSETTIDSKKHAISDNPTFATFKSDLSSNPTYNSYTLKGWAKDQYANNVLTDATPYTDLDDEVYAFYNVPYQINFSGSGCSFPSETKTYTRNDEIEFSISPSTGYKLATTDATVTYNNTKYSNTSINKSIDSDGNLKIKIINAPGENVSVGVNATLIDYSLNKNTSTGLNSIITKVDSAIVSTAKMGQTVSLSASLVDGYKVTSYSVVNDTTSESISVTNNKFTMPASSVTISATTATISYNLTKSTLPTGVSSISIKVNGSEASTATVEDTVVVTAASSTGYTIKELVFTGAKAETVTGSTATFTMPAGDVNVSVNADADKYDIIYKDGGGTSGSTFSGTHASGYPTTHTYGTATSLKTASKTGYTFGGWFTTSGCTGTAVTSLGATAYTDNITLYAKWTAKTYTITYLDQGGSTFSGTHKSGYPTSHTYGTATSLKTASKTGYTFGGWFTKSDCTGTAVTSLGATAYTANINLYAKWIINTYTITLSAETGGSVSGGGSYNYGTSVTVTATPDTGYVFEGWYENDTKIDGAEAAYTFTATKDRTLKAKFKVGARAFETCDWSYIKDACDALETANFTDDAKTVFYSKFTVNGNTPTSMNDFVGVERSVIVNSQTHKVRVIGTEHDIDTNDKTLALTFEFANLISDSNGYSLAYQWNDTDDDSSANFDYINSTIRYALTGQGTNGGKNNSTILAAQKGETTWSTTYNKTILSMLPSDLSSNLKTVKKSVGVKTSTAYDETSYEDKLFMLSVKEMGYTNGWDYGYGTTYSYYSEHTSQEDTIRVKKQVDNTIILSTYTSIASGSGQVYSNSVNNYAGTNYGTSDDKGGNYWVRSPYFSSKVAWSCYNSGNFNCINVNRGAYGVAPAFCI